MPIKNDVWRIEVAFEKLYVDIKPYITQLNERDKGAMKSKILNIFQRYSKTKNRSEDEEVIKNLTSNKDIVILKQDKGRGVVIMNRRDYVEKANVFLEGRQFKKLNSDPTRTFQKTVQDTLRTMKRCFDRKTYTSIYPSSSHPGRFFGTAKVHKVSDGVNDVKMLPIRPVISSIGTATYRTSQYLAELLKPLTSSKYTVESTKDFIDKIKQKKIDDEYSMVSFDVESLFTNVPLTYTIDIILDQIYNQNKIKTKLRKEELKTLLLLCTKGAHFTFEDQIYKQLDGVSMGSPLGPVLANVFMVHLEETLVPQQDNIMPLWLRYVDDTFTFIRKTEIQEVKGVLNNFHPNIKFTHEEEAENAIAFLDVKITRKNDGLVTDVYRKKTDTNIYINWKSFAPRTWKIGTLKGLVTRAHTICSEKAALQREIDFLKNTFVKINGYPVKTVENVIRRSFQGIDNAAVVSGNQVPNNLEIKTVNMILPYAGIRGESIVHDLKKYVEKYLPKSVKPQISYKGKKLGTRFPIKDKIKPEHQSNLVYHYQSNKNSNCKKTDNYVGETNVRIETRVYEHGHKFGSVNTHTLNCGHDVKLNEFEILAKGYPDHRERRIAESLFIREIKPSLNKQKDSYTLHLFN